MKIKNVVGSLVTTLVLTVWAAPSFAIVTDEALIARSEYYAEQAAKRREAARLRAEEEAKHLKELNVNEVLKVIADEDEQIQEVVIIYKSGVKDRYIAPKAEEEVVSTPSPQVVAPKAEKAQTVNHFSPFFNERGGRVPVW